MADIADWILDGCFLDDEGLFEYGGTKSCRCCGEDGLHWEQLDSGKWTLFNEECIIHKCPVNPLILTSLERKII